MLVARYEQGEPQPDFDANLEKAVKAGKDKDKGAVFQAASRTLAERWKSMTVAQREPYEKLADEELKKYRKQVTEYQQKKQIERREEVSSISSGVSSPSLSATAPVVASQPPMRTTEQPSVTSRTATSFAAAAGAQEEQSKPPPTVQLETIAPQHQPAVQLQPAMLQQLQQLITPQQQQPPRDTTLENIANAALILNMVGGTGGSAAADLQGMASLLLQAQSSQIFSQTNQLGLNGAAQGTANSPAFPFQPQQSIGFTGKNFLPGKAFHLFVESGLFANKFIPFNSACSTSSSSTTACSHSTRTAGSSPGESYCSASGTTTSADGIATSAATASTTPTSVSKFPVSCSRSTRWAQQLDY